MRICIKENYLYEILISKSLGDSVLEASVSDQEGMIKENSQTPLLLQFKPCYDTEARSQYYVFYKA